MNQVLKSLTGSSVRLLSSNYLKNTKKLSNISRDVVKQNSVHTDLLTVNLKNAKSVRGILELVNTHYMIMNSNHTIQALKTIFTLQKQDKSAMSTSEILKHTDFEQICNQLKYHSGVLGLDDTIEALKTLSFVGVSSHSTIYQILLQLLRHNVNQISVNQIIFVDFLLSKAQPSPLVEALQIALPIVYEIQLPTKLDRGNLSQLREHLQFVSRKNLSKESVMLIVDSLLKIKFIDEKTSISIIWSICDMPANDYFEPLVSKAIKSVVNDPSSISYQDLETTITKLLTKYNSKMSFYYNEKLFDYCTDIVIRDNLGFEDAAHLLKKYLRVNHINRDLLNYISEKCHENPDFIENGVPLHTYNIICGCALTDFRPEYYETIKESFLKIQNFDKFIHKEIYLIKFQAALAVLGIYIPEILREVWSKQFLTSVLKKNYMFDLENLLIINQAVKIFKPELSELLPEEEFLSTIRGKIRSVIFYPLEGSLHHVFGDENFVKTPALTKMLYHIDHLIVMKNGFPSALNPDDTYVEDICCETPSQIVLIMVLKHFHYTINSRQLLGHTRLMLQTLEAKGYSVVPICLEVWQSLQDFEKIPYIMEAIKSKTEYFKKLYERS